MSVLPAVYFDGKTSHRHPVSLMIGGGQLKIVGRDVEAAFDLRRVRRSLRIANTPRWFYLPGGGACVTEDNGAIDRVTRAGGYERTLHRWESRPAYAAAAVALVVGALWLMIDRGLPAAADYVAMHIPVEAETVLGRETLSGMERYFMKPSALPAKRQAALREKFDSVVRANGETVRYQLEFRSSPVIGPNAFALPAGIIVVTDELVRIAVNDNEVLAVLAHELGHVRHRHTMRRLLEGSATALIIAGVTGDITSATALAAAAPAVLLRAKYSRENEREADVYAIEMLQKAGINPGHLAAILRRMESRAPERRGMPTFLSSHPPTEERSALALEGTGVPDAEAGPQTTADAADHELVPEKPKLVAVDPVQREVIALVERRDYAGLETLLGGGQQAFEKDPATSQALENAFAAFRKLPRSAEGALSEWVQKLPSSYAALTARGVFRLAQALDARGGQYIKDTPEANLRTMRAFMELAWIDFERSLHLTPKPYVSRLSMMTIERNAGSRGAARAQYLEALKLAPQSVELHLAYMRMLEPRWGGSHKEMEAFALEARAQLKDPRAADRIAARIPAYRAFEEEQKKEFMKALGYYDEALRLDEAADLLCSRSWLLTRLNRHGPALHDVKRALAKVRDNQYCLERAVYAASQVKSDDALAVLHLVIEVDPNSAHAYNQRGWMLHERGKADLAFQDYLASARLGNDWGQLQAGKLLWSGIGVAANRDEAIDWLRKSAAQGNRDAQVSLEQALQAAGKR